MYLAIKRLFDICVGLIALPFLILSFIFVAPAIKAEDKGSIFYVANRRGKNGKIFSMLKYRSMKMNAPDIRNKDNSTFSSKNDHRVTGVGKVLRRTSLDEAPQFLNVLKGDMSLIGPRPNQPSKNYSEMTDMEKRRLSIRPGITGYSQAFYRNSVSQEDKLKYDLYYVDNMSILLDIKIMVQTVKAVLGQKNINVN